MYRCERCDKVTPPRKAKYYLYEYREKVYPPVPIKRQNKRDSQQNRRRQGYRFNDYGEQDACDAFDSRYKQEKPRTATRGYEIVHEISVCAGCFLDDKELKEKAKKEASLEALAERMTG